MSIQIYEVDPLFFKEISTEEQAYVFGFACADGYNDERFLKLTQTEPGLDIIPKIREVMRSNHPIVETKTSTGKKMFSLQINGIDLCKDLTELGCPRAKSLILKFPKDEVPEDLMHHFIRGYFDGDGCVWVGKRKKMIVKDSTRKSGERERIVQNVKFTVTSSKNFIEGLQDYLVQKLGFKKTKLNFSKAKETHSHCTMEYSGRKQMKTFYDYLYKDATIYMDWKKAKFEEICAFNEKSLNETQLIAETPLES